MLKGKSLVAGEWIGSDRNFFNEPVSGTADEFSQGTPELVDRACEAAEQAFWKFGYSSRADRASFLREIAKQIELRGPDLTEMGMKETGLPEARLEGERGRTVAQMRLFADHIEAGDYLDRRHDVALPDRAPLPRPDLRLMQRPIGPVAVFGASNFPLAFSTAGGDTASALAAGCPVVVKGHPAHPGIADIIAQAFDAAIKSTGVHPGVFSQVLDGGRIVGETLVQHPLICAVGFTGSPAGGRALFDLAAARPSPIPFYGELGSTNPVFVLPNALAHRAEEIATSWVASLTLGAGQFCTNPSVCVVVDGKGADQFVAALAKALADAAPQTMLTDSITRAYQAGVDQWKTMPDVKALHASDNLQRAAGPNAFSVSASDWLSNTGLQDEVFGPAGLVVRAKDMSEAVEMARALEGQLTCTLQMDEDDIEAAAQLMPILERKAGRILANGFPTGVEVCDSMVHGGPYPASTNFGATSVGTLSIRRFLRPVCFQNMPGELLPDDIKHD